MLSHSSQPRPITLRERFQQYLHRRSASQQSPQQEKQPLDIPSRHSTEPESHLVEQVNLQAQNCPSPERPGLTATEHHHGQRTRSEQQQQQQQRQQPVPDSHNQATESSWTSQSARPTTLDKRHDHVPRSGGAHRTSQSCDHSPPPTSTAAQHEGFGVRHPADSAHGDTTASDNITAFPEGVPGANGRCWDNQRRSPLAATIPPTLPVHRRSTSSPVAPPRSFTRRDNNLLKPPSRFTPLIPILATAAIAQPQQRPSCAEDLSTFDFILRTERSSASGFAPPTSNPDLRAQNMEPINYSDPDFRMLNRPRKLSSSSSTSTVSTSSRETLASRPRSPAWSSSATSFDSMEFINRRSSEYTYGRSSRGSSPRSYVSRWKPGEMFASLPGEVLELMLDELKKLHLRPGSESCSTCWMRDLCSISLSSRKWSKFARTSLYEDIQLNGSDSTAMMKRYKTCPAPRLVLLRRTLRSNRQIAVIARSLKVPLVAEDMSVDAYHSLVASVVMACPNFERLAGLHPRYNHTFDRLFHALSTRPKLKQMEWIVDIAPSPQRQPKGGSKHITKAAPSNLRQLPPLVMPSDILPAQSAAFLELHSNWTHLTTLTIHALPRGSLTPDGLISEAISRLPSLKHLFLSRLPFSAFKDDGLLSLPALKTLSLSHLPGISCDGLSALATRSSSRSIQRLILRHVNVDEMPALARILSNLVNLEDLAFVQSYPPLMPDNNFILLMPYLASKSLRKLHWDITSHPHCANAADSILARSIGAGGLPGLRILRAPNDPEGIFQSLCSPRDRVDMPGDRFRGSVGIHGRDIGGGARSLSVPSSPTVVGPAVKAPSTPVFAPGAMALCDATDLHRARLAAQARLEAAWRFPRFRVHVIDEDGTIVDKFGLAGYIGDTGSKIRYSLLPDRRAKDENGGLVEVEDLLDSVEGKGADACNGRWNMPEGSVDKKDRERWWHVERGRWGAVEL